MICEGEIMFEAGLIKLWRRKSAAVREEGTNVLFPRRLVVKSRFSSPRQMNSKYANRIVKRIKQWSIKVSLKNFFM